MGFSMFFSENDVVHHSSPYASVDCTLSLGTPSTRLCNDDNDRRFSSHTSNRLCWDFLHGAKKGSGGDNSYLLPRRCANCETTSTPLWRNGPRGPKVQGRETCVSTSRGGSTAAGVSTSDHHGGANYYNNNHYVSPSPWIHHQQHKVPYYSPENNEYSFVDDVREVNHDATANPFLSWRLNVTDRTSLVHDFTM
uniref:GATA-type domain-containing protein n=1 Tax=Brassica oleracea var. oleracea TaxID=109376 RepID=A0A0D3BK02_BRAOL